MVGKRLFVGLVVVALLVGLGGLVAAGAAPSRPGEIGPAFLLTPNGRALRPAGRLTQVGDLPTGGALTRDGRFYWAVDSGHGKNDVRVIDVATGALVQALPLPGAYGGIAFSPDGRTAYVSGEPRGSIEPEGPTRADAGDAVHVFRVDTATGRGPEQAPIQLPATTGGTAQTAEGGRLGWPEGLSVTPDGSRLLVVLNQADKLAVVDLTDPSHPTRLVGVGRFPNGVAADGDSRIAYVSNELDGTVSVVDVVAGTVTAAIGVGGQRGDLEAHPEGLVVDRRRHLVFVAVTNRDLVAVVDPARRAVAHFLSVGRREGIGTAPVDLAESPDGTTLYVADSGEDAVAVISLATPAFRRIGRIPTAAYTFHGRRDTRRSSADLACGQGAGRGAQPRVRQPVRQQQRRALRQLRHRQAARLRRRARPPRRDSLASVDVQGRPPGAPGQRATSAREHPGAGTERRSQPADRARLLHGAREPHLRPSLRERAVGDGDPALEVVDDNNVPGLAGGVTPDAHALARRFPLLDHFYADSEVSKDGHVITSSSYAIDFVQKALHADYSDHGQVDWAGQFPETFPPNVSLFDQAVRQNLRFSNLGEFSAGLVNDGRPTFPGVSAGNDFGYPSHFGCDGTYPDLACSTDSGQPGVTGDPRVSRFDYFQQRFGQWLAGGRIGYRRSCT